MINKPRSNPIQFANSTYLSTIRSIFGMSSSASTLSSGSVNTRAHDPTVPDSKRSADTEHDAPTPKKTRKEKQTEKDKKQSKKNKKKKRIAQKNKDNNNQFLEIK